MRALRTLRSDLIDPAIAAHRDPIVKRTGDRAIIEFRGMVDAVSCAIEVQTGLIERNAGVPSERRIEYRVDIRLGDVVEERDGDLMGDGLNIKFVWRSRFGGELKIGKVKMLVGSVFGQRSPDFGYGDGVDGAPTASSVPRW